MPRDGGPVIYEVLAPRVVVPSNVRVRLLRPRPRRARPPPLLFRSDFSANLELAQSKRRMNHFRFADAKRRAKKEGGKERQKQTTTKPTRNVRTLLFPLIAVVSGALQTGVSR